MVHVMMPGHLAVGRPLAVALAAVHDRVDAVVVARRDDRDAVARAGGQGRLAMDGAHAVDSHWAGSHRNRDDTFDCTLMN